MNQRLVRRSLSSSFRYLARRQAPSTHQAVHGSVAKSARAMVAYSWVAFLLAGALLIGKPANAQFSVFTDIISSVKTFISIGNQMSQAVHTVNNVRTTIEAPAQTLSYGKNFMHSLTNAFNLGPNGLNFVASAGVKSGFPDLNPFESAIYGNNTTAIAPQYNNLYGNRISAPNVDSSVTGVSDMADAASNDALILAANSDNFATSLINLSQNIQSQAATAAPGTADMLAAQAGIAELHSRAIQHRLLASYLRMRATRLAGDTAAAKRAIATRTSSN